MQMLAASGSDSKVKIVTDDTKSLDPTTSFSEGKGWSSESWDNED